MTTTEHQISYNAYDVYRLLLFCACDRSVRYTEAGLTRHLLDVGRDEGRQEGYAAGLAAAKGEMVTADDVPRIKPGTLVRMEFDDANKHACTGVRAVEGFVQAGRTGGLYAAGYDVSVQADRVYLLAEALDAEVREALEAAAGDSRTYAGMLDALRAAGYDVVKAVAK